MLVTIQLPVASPDLYLEWVGWWHEIERFAAALGEEAMATIGAAPAEPAIERLLPIHIRLIEVQAREAVRQGREEVSPELTGDPAAFRQSLGYSDRRGEWLLGLARSGLAVPRFPSELVPLRERVVAAIDEATSDPSTAAVPAHVVEGEEPGHLWVIGEIDISTLDPLVERFESELAAGHVLTLDMAGVSFMDSQGLRMLIRLGRHALDRALAPVVLVDPSDPVRRVIEVATPSGIPGVDVRITAEG